jgi:acyl-CoA thioesterase I
VVNRVAVSASILLLAGVLAGAGIVTNRAYVRRRDAGMVRMADAIPVHSKWWREQAKRDGALLFVAIGDSTAQGIGASRPAHSYVGMLARDLRKHTGQSVRVINLARSGARLREALAEQLPKLATLEPDILTVAIGANDIADFDAVRFEREFNELCSALPDHAIVSEVPAFYFGKAARDAAWANRIIRRIAARRGLAIVKLHAATLRQTGVWYALNQVAADFFHPNDRGYRVWADAFWPRVRARVESLKRE